jgi:hypothetical protein
MGQTETSGSGLAWSVHPLIADVLGSQQKVRFVPTTEVQVGLLATCFLASGWDFEFELVLSAFVATALQCNLIRLPPR